MRKHVSQKKQTTGFSIPSLKHPIRGFGLESSAISRQAVPEIQPLHKPVTHNISRIPLRSQAKLSISEPGDIYEQEADSVAQQVMQRMAQPANSQSIQREALPEEEEELQMKSLESSTLQREALPEEEEELQMKPMVQRQAGAGMAAAPDLEGSINKARGGGQAIADNIRKPMEQAFGADFSRVKVHTDGQSDQLNQSIQARAFTTGQDVFFRQGEYNPGSRGGQELLAHELTHIVQQNGGAVQRSSLEKEQKAPLSSHSTSNNTDVLQAVFTQNPVPAIQNSQHGGVKSQYQYQLNLIELHIDAGANASGKMMEDFLTALWEARDTIIAGQTRVQGGLFMRPGGAQVLKMTMEMLGEAIGQGQMKQVAQQAQRNRKMANTPLWVDPTGNNLHDDILDQTVVPEHLAYRDSMIGVGGIEMNPIGGGTSGGTENMLDNTAQAAAERVLYDAAMIALTPFMSLGITIDLATVNRVIAMMEGKMDFWQKLYLKALYLKNG